MQENAVRVNAENVDAICKKMEGVKDLTQHKQQIRYLVRYLANSEFERTKIWFEKLDVLSKAFNNDEFELSMILSKAIFYEKVDSIELAEKYYSVALELANKLQKFETIAAVWSAWSHIAHSKNDYAKAYEFAHKALNYAVKSGNESSVNNFTIQLMTTANSFGKSEEALALGNKFISDYNNGVSVDLMDMSNVYNALSEILQQISEHEKAIIAMHQAKDFAQKAKMPASKAIIQLRLAELLLKVKKTEEACIEMEEAYHYCTISQNKRYLIYAKLLRAEVLSKQKKRDQALKMALSINTDDMVKNNETELLVNTSILVAKQALKLKKYDLSEKYLKEIFVCLKKHEDPFKLKSAHKLAYQLFQKKGNYKKALKYHKKFLETELAVYNADRNKALAEMETKYNVVKKQQESDKHKLEKMEFQQMALRAQMNPHFIFNALNSIHDQILSHSKQSAAHYLRRFADLMRTILENSDSVSLSIENVVQFLKKYLEIEQLRFGHEFTFEITVDNEIVEDIVVIPAMVVQPYVENAIIHGISYVKEGRIKIDFLLLDDETIQCTVIDNGEGINASKSRSSKNHRSMSTNISKTRLENLSKQLNRNVSVSTIDLKDEDEDLSGTKVLITLPIL